MKKENNEVMTEALITIDSGAELANFVSKLTSHSLIRFNELSEFPIWFRPTFIDHRNEDGKACRLDELARYALRRYKRDHCLVAYIKPLDESSKLFSDDMVHEVFGDTKAISCHDSTFILYDTDSSSGFEPEVIGHIFSLHEECLGRPGAQFRNYETIILNDYLHTNRISPNNRLDQLYYLLRDIVKRYY